MSVYINKEKGIIKFSNRIAYICDVFEFKRPVIYETKKVTLDDGTSVIWGSIQNPLDIYESNVIPVTIFGKTFDDAIINAYKQIIYNYYYNDNTINDPIIKCCI